MLEQVETGGEPRDLVLPFLEHLARLALARIELLVHGIEDLVLHVDRDTDVGLPRLTRTEGEVEHQVVGVETPMLG